MKGSLLEEALDTTYGPNTVTHMMPGKAGKAISRAICGHFLVEGALVNKLMSALLPCEPEDNCPWNSTQSDREKNFNAEYVETLSSDEVDKICNVYKVFFEGSMLVSEVAELEEVLKFENVKRNIKHYLLDNLQQRSYGCNIFTM